MIYFWATVLTIINLFCLFTVAFAVPGNWLMIIATSAFAWRHRGQGFISIYTLIAITIIALIGELLEFFGGMGSAKKAGAGFWGSIGALAGAVTGAIAGTFVIPVPLVGTLLGSAVGAATGAAIFSATKEHNRRGKIAVHAGIGQFVGSSMKLLAGVVIWLISAVAAFWP